MAKLIELRDVYKIYGEGLESEVRALDGVSLDIEKGEFVAVVGPVSYTHLGAAAAGRGDDGHAGRCGGGVCHPVSVGPLPVESAPSILQQKMLMRSSIN